MNASIRSGQFAELPNGIRLHYASAGEKGKPLILFVHGFPEFWYEWEAQLAEFGRDHFAVAPDLRGFNLSDMRADPAAYKARHIVDDLRLLAAHLGYEKFVMVAHDWGGAIAWNFAIALPQLLHKLIIVNSPHPYLFMQALANDPAQRDASEYMNWLRADGSESALAKDDFALLEGLLNGMGRSPTPWFTSEVRAMYHA
ncbi:MAG: alpha/beta fold hydrolase, partial [Noviherbaspirillum sp.]